MYIRLSATWLKDEGKRESLIVLSQTILIENLRKIVEERTGLEPELQRLFYRGKELVDGHILNDYSVVPNDVILLAKRCIPVDEPNNASSSYEHEKDLEKEGKTYPTESIYYTIGDMVDVKDETDQSWYEAKILGIFKNTDQDDVEEENLIFEVQSEDHVYIFPCNEMVGFKNIRPVSYYNYKIPELSPGMTVLANYNIDSPKQRGLWYDFHITKVNSIDIYGTLMIESSPVENCNIKFIQEFMRIEKPKLKKRERDAIKIHKRKYPYNCDRCKDNKVKACKECSCDVCGIKENWDKIILCDDCNLGVHIYCLDPPLEMVPHDDWYCSSCKRDTSEIVNPGEKLKFNKRKQTKSKKSTSNRNWGGGMACVGVPERNDIVPTNHVVSVPGVAVGSRWKFRQGVAQAGIHRPLVAGIHGKASDCAYSVVLSGGYEDDVDNGKEFLYTGSGGRDLARGKLRTSTQSFDQTLTRTNRALAMNCNAKFDDKNGAEATDWKGGKPMRVVRSYKLVKHSKYAPKEGFRYDGIYKVVKYFQEKGQSGFLVWRYLLRRDDPSPAPWEKEGKTLDLIYPENYLESQAEKQREKEKKKNEKPGSAKKKRNRLDVNLDESDISIKKPKYTPYKIKPATLKAIRADTLNKKLWLECIDKTKDGQQKFSDKVKEIFVCIICRSLVNNPLTFKCRLNICSGCVKDSLKHCDTEIFHCPHCRVVLGQVDTFIDEIDEFQNEKLKKALNMLFPGYGKA